MDNPLILVTGGAGFIGSNFIWHWVRSRSGRIVNLDKLTYAGNPSNLSGLDAEGRYRLVVGDIGDRALVESLLREHRPTAIINFAAESHVDRSIHGPDDFIRTNVNGTFSLLEATRAYWSSLEASDRAAFRFLHVSTDEVYGSLGERDIPFHEATPYAPNSPYSASKAASDHLVRAWYHTYGLPVLTTHCSNNYGPFQFPEKLIPLMVLNALAGRPLPVYGDGRQVRDWLHVHDHCRAIVRVLESGQPGQTYNIGGNNQLANIEVVHQVCALLDELRPRTDGRSHAHLIQYVTDRPGHDRRYAINAGKILGELGWRPSETFMTGLRKTVQWYLEHPQWVSDVQNGEYRQWMDHHYGKGA